MPDKTISYIVDGHDRRSAKLVDSTVVSRYLWQSQYRLAAELNADGTMRKQFVYGDGVNSPEYMIYQSKRYHLVKDHRGSVNLVVDLNSGTIEQKITYSEFGEVLSDTNPGFQPFGFAGGLYDSDTKLVRFGARDYDGKIGRWLAKDPIRFAGGDENLYGYVLNDPVNFVDVSGLLTENEANCLKNVAEAYYDMFNSSQGGDINTCELEHQRQIRSCGNVGRMDLGIELTQDEFNEL